MKRLPIDYAILGHKYASALSDCLSSDGSGSVIYYLGEMVNYEYFSNQLQKLAKNIYLKMTIIFDISMVEDKAKLTQYCIYLRAMFPKSRIIVVAPGLNSEALISNILCCGIYDIVTDDLGSLNDSQKIATVCRIVDTAVDHPKSFADIYNRIQWQIPVLTEVSNEPKGLLARRKARKEAKKAEKLARKEAKEKAKNAPVQPQIDPYEAFLNGSDEIAVREAEPQKDEEVSAVNGGYSGSIEYVENLDDLFE